MSQPPTPEPPPSDGKVLSWLNAVKGLTVTNALVIIMLVVIAIPAYLVYRMTVDDDLLDRFLSNYREISAQNVGCTVREAKYRGGSTIWGISTGLAFQGRDRYTISVILDHEPNNEELVSYCETVKTMAESLQGAQ